MLDRPCLADDRPQLDRALNARLARDRRIARLHLVEEVGLRQVRYKQGLNHGRAHRNHDRDVVSDAAGNAIAWSATRSSVDGWEVWRGRNRVAVVVGRDLARDRPRRDDLSLARVADRSGRMMAARRLLCCGWRECCGR